MLWFDLVPQKSGGCSLDSAKPPGVRGNWWLFGSCLECEMPFNTGFMSSDAWDLWSLKGPGSARVGWTIRWVKKGNSSGPYSEQKLQENSYIPCLILYINFESQWKKQTVTGLDPGPVEAGLCFCFAFHQTLNTPIFSSALAGKKNGFNKELFTHQLSVPLSLLQNLGASRSRAFL